MKVPQKAILITILLSASAVAVFALPTESSCIESNRALGSFVGYDRIRLVPQGIPGGLLDEFQRGYGEWNQDDCNSRLSSFDGAPMDEGSFPLLQEGIAGANRTVNVIFHAGSNPNNPTSCGQLRGDDVDLYE